MSADLEVVPAIAAAHLATGYAGRRVLEGVTFNVSPGEVVAVIGHNGAGKTTLLKALFGLLPIWSGTVHLNGQLLAQPTPRELIDQGVRYLPQSKRAFDDLSVLENLDLVSIASGRGRCNESTVQRVGALFPALGALLSRRASTLSGGERQMLAMAMTLAMQPRLLLLDEPSLGLAPQLVSESLAHLRQLATGTGVAVLMVEQKVREALRVSDRVVVLRRGSVSYVGPASSLLNMTRLRDVYL